MESFSNDFKVYGIERVSPFDKRCCELCSRSSDASPKGMLKITILTTNAESMANLQNNNETKNLSPKKYSLEDNGTSKIVCAVCCDKITKTKISNGITRVPDHYPMYIKL